VADPVRALRAARLVSELGLEVDPELEAALQETAPVFEKWGGRRARVEIDALLVGPHARRALELLVRTRIGAALAPGAADDLAAVVSRLPDDLELRLAGWLRGAPAAATLRKLRCPRDRAVRVERMLQMHPVDAGPRAAREARARRLARRPEAERAALLALRAAELDAAPADALARGRLDHLIECLDRAERAHERTARRATLALDGLGVMAHLGCGPGATVGRALRFLADQIERDPTRNQPAALRTLLDSWPRDS
jgi:tRNA nucleotidyltransferase/poly(A) polymerase